MILIECRLEGGTVDAACLFSTGRPRMRSHQVIVLVPNISFSTPDSPCHDRDASKDYSTSDPNDDPNDYALGRCVQPRATSSP